MANREDPDPPLEKRRFKEFLDLGEPAGGRPEEVEPSAPDPWPAQEVTPGPPDPWAHEVPPRPADPWAHEVPPAPPEVPAAPPDPWAHEVPPAPPPDPRPAHEVASGPPDPWPAHEVAPGPADPWPPEDEARPGDPEPFEDAPPGPEPFERPDAPLQSGRRRARARTPDVFEDVSVDPRAFQRLLKVTGAVVLLLIILSVTDALILHAVPLIFIAIVAALFYYAGFIAPTFAFRWYGKAGFAIVAALFCVTAYLGWQGKQSARGLARVIVPVPEIVHVTYAPADDEMTAALALSVTLEAIDGALSRQRGGRAPDPEERTRRARVVNESARHYWVVETDLSIPQIMEFYARPENTAGWAIVARRAEGLLSLRRGADELLIMASDGFPRARSKVGYLYVGVEQER